MKPGKLWDRVGMLFLCVLFAGATCVLHFGASVNSMLNHDETWQVDASNLEYTVRFHQTELTFARRPLTTWLIEATASVSGMDIAHSFILVGFVLLAASGFTLYLVSRKLDCDKRFATVNVIVYFLCFSNIFAFFPPVYTYDEPLQYTCIFLAFLFFYRRQKLLFLFFFTLAVIARESTLLLLPALFFFAGPAGDRLSPIRKVKKGLYLVIPVVVYVLFTVLLLHYGRQETAVATSVDERLGAFDFNFGGQQATVETFLSIFVTCGAVLYFLAAKHLDGALKPEHKQIVKAFLLTFFLNTLVVLFFTRAREARLFALPLVFVWPVFAELFREELRLLASWRNYKLLFRTWYTALFFLLGVFLANVFANKVFQSTVGGKDYFSQYLFVLSMVLLLHFFMRLSLKRTL